MVGVAQLVRALGCGPRGCRFKSGHSPSGKVLWRADLQNKQIGFFILLALLVRSLPRNHRSYSGPTASYRTLGILRGSHAESP